MGIFSLLFVEGAFSTAFETWTGPLYLSGVAGAMGVGVRLLSLITIAPFLGAIFGAFGQFFGFRAFAPRVSVRKYVVFSAAAARGLWLIPVVAGWYWGLRAGNDPPGFSSEKLVFTHRFSGHYFADPGLDQLIGLDALGARARDLRGARAFFRRTSKIRDDRRDRRPLAGCGVGGMENRWATDRLRHPAGFGGGVQRSLYNRARTSARRRGARRSP